MGKSREQIGSSGYVVHSLEAALWCFARHNSFEAAVLEAANLGDDADTTAAITGQIAGAFWGAAAFLLIGWQSCIKSRTSGAGAITAPAERSAFLSNRFMFKSGHRCCRVAS